MAALGLVILVLAGIVAFAGGLSNSGSDHLVDNFTILGMEMSGSSGRLFLYGAAIGAIGMLGLNMLLAGLGKGFKNKVRHHRQTKQEHARQEELEEERNRLENDLRAERGAHNDRDRVDLTDGTDDEVSRRRQIKR